MLLPMPVSPPAIHAKARVSVRLSNGNWGGVLLSQSGTPAFWGIATTFTVPNVAPPVTPPPQGACLAGMCGAVSYWVGIGGGDGGAYDHAIAQAGVLFSEKGGAVTGSAFAEAFPQAAVLSSFAVSPGDVIEVSITPMAALSAAGVPELQYAMNVTDQTTGNAMFEMSPPMPNGGADTAEWVEETPKFTATTGSKSVSKVLPLLDTTPITMSQNLLTTAQPTLVSGEPAVTWQESSLESYLGGSGDSNTWTNMTLASPGAPKTAPSATTTALDSAGNITITDTSSAG